MVTIGFEPDPFLSLVNQELARAGVLDTTVNGGFGKSLHKRAWASRLEPLPLKAEGSITELPGALRQVFMTMDRVFVQAQPSRELLFYVDWLEHFAWAKVQGWTPNCNVIFARTPHYPYELVLASVAQAAGHQVFTLSATPLADRIVLEAGTAYDKPVLLRNFDAPNASPENGRRWTRIQNALIAPARAARVKDLFGLIMWLLFPKSPRKSISRHALNRKNQSIFSRAVLLGALVDTIRSRARARRAVARLSRANVLGPMVVIALHYQPERTTDPEAGRYSNQVQFVADFRAAMNAAGLASMSVMVKFHPRQFAAGMPGLSDRYFCQPEYVDAIGRIEGVGVLPLDSSFAELSDSIVLVATPNGSMAWQALSNGIPAVIGRAAWMSDCEAVATLQGAAEDSVVVANLLSMSRKEVRAAVTQFLDSTPYLFRGSTGSVDVVTPDICVLAAQMAAELRLTLSEV